MSQLNEGIAHSRAVLESAIPAIEAVIELIDKHDYASAAVASHKMAVGFAALAGTLYDIDKLKRMEN